MERQSGIRSAPSAPPVVGERVLLRGRPLPYQPLVLVVVAAAVGILVDRHWPVSATAWWTSSAAAWVLWLVVWRCRRERLAGLLILASVAALAGGWHHACWSLYDVHEIGRHARWHARPAAVEAIVLAAPRAAPTPPPHPLRIIPARAMNRVRLEAVAILDGGEWRPAAGRLHLTVACERLELRVGDRVRLFGQLSAPRPMHNPGETDFANHARRDRVLAWMFLDDPRCIERIAAGGPSPMQWLEEVRAAGDRFLFARIPSGRAGLAAAVLLGAREHLERDHVAAYVETGSVHILSISGLHVSILAGFLYFGLRQGLLPRRLALLLVAVVIVAYTVLTRAEAPIVRSAVMVVTLCIAAATGRRALSMNTLAIAALIVLALHPTDLFATGVQLSFLAMAVLIWCGAGWVYSPPVADPLERLILQSRPLPVRATRWVGRWAGKFLLVSAGIWTVTTPLSLANFHLISPIGIPMNIVLWLPMTLAMFTGFWLLLLGWTWSPLGNVLGVACDQCLRLLDDAVHFARDVPLGWWWSPGPDDWWLIGYYGLLAVGLCFPRLRPPRRWIVATLAAWCAVGLGVAWQRARPSGVLDCTILSVGHGCSTLITLPDGRTLLYDAGTLSGPDSGARAISDHLWHRGLWRIDALVISHADADHFNAVPDLLRRFRVGVVYVSPVMWTRPSAATRALRQALVDHRCEIRPIHASHSMRGGFPINGTTTTDRNASSQQSFEVRVLHPSPAGVPGNDNANSVVLGIEFAGRRILLTGDLERAGLARVIAQPRLDCDVVLAPHHGSAHSSPAEFAAWCTPQYVIISGGARADTHAVETTCAAVAAKVLHTADVGAIQSQVSSNGELTVRTLGRMGPGPMRRR